jgi:hypothetical protein
MADSSWIGIASAIGAAIIGGVSVHLGSKRAAAANTEVAKINTMAVAETAKETANSTERVKTLEMVADQLKVVQARSDTLETTLRAEMSEIRAENKLLQKEVSSLTLQITQNENAHLHKEREWSHDTALQIEKLNIQQFEIIKRDTEIAQKDTRIERLILLLERHLGDVWKSEEKEMIGDTERPFRDQFTSRLQELGSRVLHEETEKTC